MSAQEWSNLKAKGPCECGLSSCELYGTLGRPDKGGARHIRGCACNRCRGRRNRAKGQRKQRAARKALGIPGPTLGADHEELWRGAVRVEVKAGGRMANPVETRWRAMKNQSDASTAFGDNRPFAAVVMPDGVPDGIVMIRTTGVADFAYAVVEWMENQ